MIIIEWAARAVAHLFVTFVERELGDQCDHPACVSTRQAMHQRDRFVLTMSSSGRIVFGSSTLATRPYRSLTETAHTAIARDDATHEDT